MFTKFLKSSIINNVRDAGILYPARFFFYLNAPARSGRKNTATPMVEKSSTATPMKARAATEYVITFFMLL